MSDIPMPGIGKTALIRRLFQPRDKNGRWRKATRLDRLCLDIRLPEVDLADIAGYLVPSDKGETS